MRYMSNVQSSAMFGLLNETVKSGISNGLSSGIKEEINDKDSNNFLPLIIQDGLAGVAGAVSIAGGKTIYNTVKSGFRTGIKKGLLNMKAYKRIS